MSLIPLKFENHKIRTVTEGDKILFVARDIAIALGYTKINQTIITHCKGEPKWHPLQTAGGIQEVRVIQEPDVYRLITSSKLPAAEKFERWVFEEVLPSIRKDGSYSAPIQKPKSLLPADKEFRAAVRMAKAAGLKGNQAVLSANQLAYKITGTDCLELLGATHLITEDQKRILTPTEIGDQVGLSARKVNKILESLGFQKKDGNVWKVTEKGESLAVLLDTGKKHKSGVMVQQVKWKEPIVKFLVPEAAA